MAWCERCGLYFEQRTDCREHLLCEDCRCEVCGSPLRYIEPEERNPRQPWIYQCCTNPRCVACITPGEIAGHEKAAPDAR